MDMSYHQNSAGHGGRRCETARKTEVKIHGHHQEGHQKECADGRQHSRPQELEIGSDQGDPLTWKSLQGEKGEKSISCVCVSYNTIKWPYQPKQSPSPHIIAALSYPRMAPLRQKSLPVMTRQQVP